MQLVDNRINERVVFCPGWDNPVTGHSVDFGLYESYNEVIGLATIRIFAEVMPNTWKGKTVQRPLANIRAY